MRFYDITASFSEDLPIYADDPHVSITEVYSITNGNGCNLSRLTFGSHTGTHVDVPKHFFDDGETCETIPLDYFYGTAKLFDLRPVLEGRRSIVAADLEALDIREGDIILLNTGNSPLMLDKHFHTDYVSLSPDAAQWLVRQKIKTLGIDYLSIEAYGSHHFGAHKALLGNQIVILEGLVLDGVLQGTYTLSALPLKILDGNGSPVRAVLIDERSLDLVIFDMDGLMLDTEGASIKGWQEAGRQLGYDFPLEIFDDLFGCGLAMCKERMIARYPDIDFEAAYAIRSAYVHEYTDRNGIAVKPGLFPLLDWLDEMGIKKCVASSTRKDRVEQCLRLTNLSGRFDAIIGGDNVRLGKPDPEIFLKAAADCGVKPQDCLVLEDSPTGIEAAYAGGLRAVMVPDRAKPDNQTLSRVCAVCRDLHEAIDIIRAVAHSPAQV